MNKKTRLSLNTIKNNCNKILIDSGCILQILEIKRNIIILNNNKKIETTKERQEFLRRIKSKYFIKDFDILYGNNKEESEKILKKIKSHIALIGYNSTSYESKQKFLKYASTKGRISHLKNKKGSPCWAKGKTKDTNTSLKKISERMKTNENPSIKYYKKIFTEKYKKNISEKLKTKILNGEFTPNSNNRNTHFDSLCMGKKFRSSWEAVFFFFNKDCLYEKIRIPYIYNNKKYIYITDFFDNKNKIIYEIKPKKFLSENKTKEKIEQAKKYCVENNYKYILLNENDIILYIKQLKNEDFDHFDEKTKNKIKKYL